MSNSPPQHSGSHIRFILFLAFLMLLPFSITLAQEPTNSDNYASAQGTDSWKLFTDTRFGISFEYPDSWEIAEFVFAAENYYGLDLWHRSLGWITISREENSERLSPEAWLDHFGRNYRPGLASVIGQVEVQGSSTLLLGQPATCRTSPMIVAVITHNEDVFVVSHVEHGERPVAVEIKHLLETLSFDGQDPTPLSLPASHFYFPQESAMIDCPAIASDSPLDDGIANAVINTDARICPGADFYIPTEGNMNVPWKCFDDDPFCYPYKPRPPDDPGCGEFDIFCNPHSGLDIFGDPTPGVTPVYATYSGTVQRIGSSAIRLRMDGPFEGYWAYMSHMATGSGGTYQDFRAVDTGDNVLAGETIGWQGDYNTGSVHLHVSYNNQPTDLYTEENPTLDPTPFLKARNLKYEDGWNHVGNPVQCIEGSISPGSGLDVYLLVDLTGSFWDDLPLFKAQAPAIISTLRSLNPDTRFGLGKFEDYPIPPFGDASCGDQAYQRLVDLTFDTDVMLSAISSLFVRCGADIPESQLAALYQAATGAGQDLSGVGFPSASIPAGEQASFRPEATKLILLWTDAPFHRPGDPGAIPYPGPGFVETAAAILNAGIAPVPTVSSNNFGPLSHQGDIGPPAKVIGISSGGAGVSDLELIARFTGAVAPLEGVDCDGNGLIDIGPGQPLVCTIGSSGEGIAEAIIALVQAASEPTVIEVEVDIKPGSDPNSINCLNGRGLIPVAILTTDDFDATTVDHTTVTFEGASEAHIRHGVPIRHEEDVDGDGRLDLMFHFRLQDTGLTCESTVATLIGETFDGQAIEGQDSVRMIRPGR